MEETELRVGPDLYRAGGQLHSSGETARHLAVRGWAVHPRSVEIFAIIIPIFVALLLGAWAVLQPSPVDVVADRIRVDQHIAWLEERLAHARAGNWDEQMMANLHAQLEEAYRTQRALAG